MSFFAGVTLTAASVALFALVAPYGEAQEDAQTPEATPAPDGTSLGDLTTAFQQVRSEIQDPDTREFYDKLIGEYDLGDSLLNVAGMESADGQTALPDIKRIQQAALTLPLLEAGKQIRDKDIAEFYRRFLQETGLAVTLPDAKQ